MRFEDYNFGPDPLDHMGLYVDYKGAKEKDGVINISIRKRPLFGRIRRLPGVIKHNWKFAKGAPLWDRVSFTWGVIKIILK